MSYNDPHYLKTQQYRDASNINARIALHERFSTNPYGWMRWVFDQFDLPPCCRILELGCGPATLWRDNLERIPPGWEITLSDFSEGMLQDARSNLGAHSYRFVFRQIDAQSIPFADETFDAVIANHMLYHVPDQEKALAEIGRVLVPSGVLYATTVGENHLREISDMARQFEPRAGEMHALFTGTFTLENGQEKLADWFSCVTLRRYPDSLKITEAEPLMAYLLSSSRYAQMPLSDERLAAAVRFLEQEIANNGAIHITKDSGMFVAE